MKPHAVCGGGNYVRVRGLAGDHHLFQPLHFVLLDSQAALFCARRNISAFDIERHTTQHRVLPFAWNTNQEPFQTNHSFGRIICTLPPGNPHNSRPREIESLIVSPSHLWPLPHASSLPPPFISTSTPVRLQHLRVVHTQTAKKKYNLKDASGITSDSTFICPPLYHTHVVI